MKAGDPVEIVQADGARNLGVIQDISDDVVTVVFANSEGDISVMVRSHRLTSTGKNWWQLEMRVHSRLPEPENLDRCDNARRHQAAC
jgi:hypothetical protein